MPVSGSSSRSTRSTQSTRSTRTTQQRTTNRTTRTNQATRSKKAAGANPKLAKMVKSIGIQRYAKKGNTTFCNQAFNAYAAKHGFKGFNGLVANQMFKKMSAPGSGWKKVSAQDAIAAAKKGKLVAAGWYNNTPQKGRPDGKRPGHIAAVIGEWSPGVPGIAQAGTKTFEWGSITLSRKNPTYFVKQ
jgi:hypothetical protein